MKTFKIKGIPRKTRTLYVIRGQYSTGEELKIITFDQSKGLRLVRESLPLLLNDGGGYMVSVRKHRIKCKHYFETAKQAYKRIYKED